MSYLFSVLSALCITGRTGIFVDKYAHFVDINGMI